MYKVGDQVHVDMLSGVFTITSIRSEFNAWPYIITDGLNYYDASEKELSPASTYHACAPYLGIIHVDPTCVYCSRAMSTNEVQAYIKEKISL